MPRSFWSVLYLTLTQFRSYVLLTAWQWKNFIRYMLLVLGLFSFLFVWIQLPALILTVADMTDWAVRKLPTLRIHDEMMEILEPKEKPWQIDLKGEIPFFAQSFLLELLPQEGETFTASRGLQLSRQKIILRYEGMEKEFTYPENLSVTISPFTLMEWRDLAYWILPVYFGFRTFIAVSIFKFLEALLFGTFFFVVLKLLRRNMPWAACCFLSGAAMGPAMIFSFVVGFFIPTLTFLIFFYYLIYFIYSTGAVVSTLKSLPPQIANKNIAV